jgi:glycosyltransferase involved in cell wall biosynthesis
LETGLSERATLVGDQQDVTRYLSVMDVMIFPSAHEGLGIVMLEAQAAGVPVVASDQVPEDGIVLPNAVERLSLQLGPAVWCAAIQRGLAAPVKDPAKTAAQMAQSEFAITRSVEQLCKVYRGDYNKL